MKRTIIGLVGLIGSGKGTAGEILERWGYRKDAFAGPVKDATAAIFGWDRALLEGDTADSRAFREQPDDYWSGAMGKPFTPRLALQLMGTEAGRSVFHKDLWVCSLIQRMNSKTGHYRDFVITDVRFPNEINALKRFGGIIVHIQRGETPDWVYEAIRFNQLVDWNFDPALGSNPSGFPHFSEWAWCGYPGIDILIENNGSVEELEEKLRKI